MMASNSSRTVGVTPGRYVVDVDSVVALEHTDRLQVEGKDGLVIWIHNQCDLRSIVRYSLAFPNERGHALFR